MNLLMLDHQLAVVPIVVNAGAAILPALAAGLVSMAAILVRPREWGRVIREKPYVPVVLLLLIASVWAGFHFWNATTTGTKIPRDNRPSASSNSSDVDWTKVALQYIENKQRNTARSVDPTTTTRPTAAAPADQRTEPFIARVDTGRSGFVGGATPGKLAKLWNWSDTDDPFAMFCSSLAVDGNWVYGASASISPPDTFGGIFCLDATTGRPRWPVVTKAGSADIKGVFSSPALTADGKLLVIGEGLHEDRDSALMCFETATGKLRWRVQTPLHVESSPAISGDIAVVGAGSVEDPATRKPRPGDNPGFVFAVRISDGKQLWQYPVTDPESSPVIKDNIAYIGSGVNGNEVVALRIESDEELKANGLDRVLWRSKTPYAALASVSIAGDLILIGCGDGDFIRPGPHGTVVAIDRKTGAIRWQTDAATTPASVLSPIAVRDNIAIAGVGNGEVVAIDLVNGGKLLWRARVSEAAPVNAGPAITDSHVYALSADGWLAVIDRTDGKLLERHFVNDRSRPGELGMSFSGPIVANGKLFVASETGGVVAFESKGGP